jgi:MFS family permease
LESDSLKKERGAIDFGRINPVIKFLTVSDILMLGSIALISPVFAVFITGQITHGSIEVIGIAEGVYLAARSIAQIPFGRFIDKIKGEKDDFWVLFIGSLVLSSIPVLYIFCDTPIKLYIVQLIYGLVSAATLPTFLAMFSRHIDREHEGADWGIYQTLAGLSSAACASLGGFLAAKYGFTSLFIVVSSISFVGAFFLAGVYRHMRSGGVLHK